MFCNGFADVQLTPPLRQRSRRGCGCLLASYFHSFGYFNLIFPKAAVVFESIRQVLKKFQSQLRTIKSPTNFPAWRGMFCSAQLLVPPRHRRFWGGSGKNAFNLTAPIFNWALNPAIQELQVGMEPWDEVMLWWEGEPGQFFGGGKEELEWFKQKGWGRKYSFSSKKTLWFYDLPRWVNMRFSVTYGQNNFFKLQEQTTLTSLHVWLSYLERKQFFLKVAWRGRRRAPWSVPICVCVLKVCKFRAVVSNRTSNLLPALGTS